MISNLLALFGLHFIADFPWQGDWLGLNKGKNWELMVYHCLIYAGSFAVFTNLSWKYIAIIFVTHLIIDPLKARWGIIKAIWQDQVLHLLVLTSIWLMVK